MEITKEEALLIYLELAEQIKHDKHMYPSTNPSQLIVDLMNKLGKYLTE